MLDFRCLMLGAQINKFNRTVPVFTPHDMLEYMDNMFSTKDIAVHFKTGL